MKKRTIWAMLALMLIGLLGIVVVQVYWLARAAALEQSLFKQRVHRSLNNVARQLEIRETKSLVMESLNDVRKRAESARARRKVERLQNSSFPRAFLQSDAPDKLGNQTPNPTATAPQFVATSNERLCEHSNEHSNGYSNNPSKERSQEIIKQQRDAKRAERDAARRAQKALENKDLSGSAHSTQTPASGNPAAEATLFSMQSDSVGFEMRFGDGVFAFRSSSSRSSSSHSPEPRSTAPNTSKKRARGAAQQEQNIPPPPAPPASALEPEFVLTMPSGGASPQTFRLVIPRAGVFQRDSLAYRIRRAARQAGNLLDNSHKTAKTLEEQMSAGVNEPSLEESTAPNNRERAIWRAILADPDARNVWREFQRSQQRIARLRALQGKNTREIDSLFDMSLRRAWDEFQSFGFELRALPQDLIPFGASPQGIFFNAPSGLHPSATFTHNAFTHNNSSAEERATRNAKGEAHKPSLTTSSPPSSGTDQPRLSSGNAARQQENKQENKQEKSKKQALGGAAEARQDCDTISKILDKVDLIEHILENMVARKQSALDRASVSDIEELLAAEMSGNGIGERYVYGVLRARDEFLPTPPRGDSATILHAAYSPPNTGPAKERAENKLHHALRESEFRAQLFPNDIFAEDHKEYLAVYFPDENDGLTLASIAPVLGSSALFLSLIIGCFGVTLLALMKQKKLSDMKTDFINNMTHELKTPIATISIASEALKDAHVRSDAARIERFVHVIHEENKRLAGHVEKVLQAAQMDRGELSLNIVPTDMHEVVAAVADSLALQVEQKEGVIELQLDAHNPFVHVDAEHIRNVVVNLLDNANKYSPEKPRISIATRNAGGGLALMVKDNGIGMSREAQKQIFEKFYRVSTGNRHDVKGFGLGLSYVKTIVEAHGGSISVKSEPTKGSVFEIFLPSLASGKAALQQSEI
jgi:two-component system phosphate regulon sensor histidine kinase PhoR